MLMLPNLVSNSSSLSLAYIDGVTCRLLFLLVMLLSLFCNSYHHLICVHQDGWMKMCCGIRRGHGFSVSLHPLLPFNSLYTWILHCFHDNTVVAYKTCSCFHHRTQRPKKKRLTFSLSFHDFIRVPSSFPPEN